MLACVHNANKLAQQQFVFGDTLVASKESGESPASSFSSSGGKASAAKLTSSERKERARNAAAARWHKDLPKATYGSKDSPLIVGGIEIACYVLDDATRVITHRGLQRSIGMAQSGGAQRMVNLIASFESKGIDCKDLRSRIESPVEFQIQDGNRAFGYEATVLADICDALLSAQAKGVLLKQQAKFAKCAEILKNGFARVGIIALIDEATGFQYSRARNDLNRLLEQYLSKELARWARAFEADFYKHLHRLKGWKYDPESTKRSHAVARLTVNLTYDRIHPELLKELKSAKAERGKPGQKLHQWLSTTPNGGHPRLKQHLEGITALLKVASSWNQFQWWVDQHYPKLNQTMLLPFPEPENEEVYSES